MSSSLHHHHRHLRLHAWPEVELPSRPARGTKGQEGIQERRKVRKEDEGHEQLTRVDPTCQVRVETSKLRLLLELRIKVEPHKVRTNPY
jgi:hypothetical protein